MAVESNPSSLRSWRLWRTEGGRARSEGRSREAFEHRAEPSALAHRGRPQAGGYIADRVNAASLAHRPDMISGR